MANKKEPNINIFSENDPLDINELASLNDDITPEFIEQLQNQVAQNASEFTGRPLEIQNDDSELFEEVQNPPQNENSTTNFSEDFDDNFVKKYKAKLSKEQSETTLEDEKKEEKKNADSIEKENEKKEETSQKIPTSADEQPVDSETAKHKKKDKQPKVVIKNDENIDELTSGNIIEKPITKEEIEYNESLDFIDGNIKFAKYVIYIAPENTDFIESLTVKERKNLINRILREQNNISITKRRFELIQTIIKHTVIAILTTAISIPAIYWTINAALEATINNYRHSQTVFTTLYKEQGKIKKQK